MSKYYGSGNVSKVYPKRAKKTIGIEMDKSQATKVLAAVASYVASPESDTKRLIMAVYKTRTGKKSGNVPFSFTAGKNKG